MNKIFRSRTNKKLAGVFGGLSLLTKVDVTLFRIGYIVLAILTGIVPAIFVYLCAWLIIPKEPKL